MGVQGSLTDNCYLMRTEWKEQGCRVHAHEHLWPWHATPMDALADGSSMWASVAACWHRDMCLGRLSVPHASTPLLHVAVDPGTGVDLSISRMRMRYTQFAVVSLT